MQSLRLLVFALMTVAAGTPNAAQQLGASQSEPSSPQPSPSKAQDSDEEPMTYDTVMVVSASKAPQQLIDAPAAVSVVVDRTIETAAAQHVGDVLRTLPGVNVIQRSARDIHLTSRGAAGLLAPQLVLLDGRPLYQDSVGSVFWDLAPIDLDEIKRIEVVRGPASAVWGANALHGVVNIIAKSPREMLGSALTLGTGIFERSSQGSDTDSGRIFYIRGRHAQAVNDRWAYKISAATYTQDALPRPTGTINETLGFRYPRFTNEGTRQPKVDARADYSSSDNRRRLEVAGGVAFTEGMLHSALGPFAIERGSHLGYARASYHHGGFRATYFTNQLKGDAVNQLMQNETLRTSAFLEHRRLPDAPITLDFEEQTHDVEISHTGTFATHHVVSYGGNWRHNIFDLSLLPSARSVGRIAPLERSRTQGGAYAEDVIRISQHIRAVLNGRLDYLDHVDYLDKVDGEILFSPRAALIFNPAAKHAVHFVYSRGYRTPSIFESFFEARLAEPVDLGVFDPLLAGSLSHLPIYAFGNERSRLLFGGRPVARPVQPSLSAFGLGYTGQVGSRSLVTAAFYANKMRDEVGFVVRQRYTASGDPIGGEWWLPNTALALIPGGSLPAGFVYRTLGDVTRKGFELEVNSSINNSLNVVANYTWQGRPDPQGFDIQVFADRSARSEVSQLSIPPRHRLNGGLTFSSDRWLGSASISYTDKAFWRDVLDGRFHGITPAYTLVNARVGVRWGQERFVTSLAVVNVFNQEIQQHIFGDIIKRQVIGELRVNF